MATWHVSIDPSVGTGSRFTPALHALILKPVQAEFESLGFTVRPMPESSVAALSVTHASEGAVTLYLLKRSKLMFPFYSAENIVIQRVV